MFYDPDKMQLIFMEKEQYIMSKKVLFRNIWGCVPFSGSKEWTIIQLRIIFQAPLEDKQLYDLSVNFLFIPKVKKKREWTPP